MIIYGIKNCDTVKKALQWMKSNNKTFEFHDYKSKGISEEKLRAWSRQKGWETLINKKGTTWRQLEDSEKASITNEEAAIALMCSKTSIIRRPLIEVSGKVIAVGFDEKEYSTVV